MAKRDLRERARRLRVETRLSNREILERLEHAVNMSTVTRWLMDIPLSSNERAAKRIATALRDCEHQAISETTWDRSMGPRAKGRFAELKVQMRGVELGVVLSRPTVDAKYDFVMDSGGTLERVQVKFAAGRPSSAQGSVWVQLSRRGKRLYSKGSIDAILAYVPCIDGIVKLLPPDFEGKSGVALRIQPALNGAKKNTIYVQDRSW